VVSAEEWGPSAADKPVLVVRIYEREYAHMWVHVGAMRFGLFVLKEGFVALWDPRKNTGRKGGIGTRITFCTPE